MFDREHLEKMHEGVQLFNEQKYWECHEALEDVWMEDRQDPIRNIYWAVIQVAAACIHYRNENLIGCQGMITKAREKFKRCRDMHLLSDLAFKYLDWQELEEIVARIPQGDESKLSDFKELFEFRFKSFPT
jgi:predicted metal-dependent hydrolase